MRPVAKLLLFLGIVFAILAAFQFNAIADSAQQGQPFLTVQNVQDTKIMGLFGFVSAVGSMLWGAIEASWDKNRKETLNFIWSNVVAGFLLGSLGGLGLYEYALGKYGKSFDHVAIAGGVTLLISMFAVPILRQIFRLGNDKIDKLGK